MMQAEIPGSEQSEIENSKRNLTIEHTAELVRSHPGHTSAELAKQSGKDRTVIARRLPDAANHPGTEVYRGQTRSCSVTGRRAITWWPRDVGASA